MIEPDNPAGGEAMSEGKALTSQAKWNAAHPKERWAQNALRSALKRGLIQRGHCEVCGEPEVDGHHDDYDAPMKVRWLCRLHHRQHHSAEARAEAVSKRPGP